jgi:hypothetical protein
MINNVEIYKEKGNYNHPQPTGFVAVKQYIFARAGEKRTLLLRFANESPLAVEGFEMLLTELDRQGKVIRKNKITYTDSSIAAGGTYTPPGAIVVSDGCTDFRVQVLSLRSGTYRYTLRRGQLVSHYDKLTSPQKKKRPKHGYIEVRSVGSRDGKTFALIAAIAIVLIGITAAMSRYHSKDLSAYGIADTSSYASL